LARENVSRLAFNRGLVSRLALARVDLTRMQLSAEEQTNWMPRTLGPMMLRPGLQYIGTTNSNQPVRMVPFVFAVDDTATLEFTDDTVMRIRVDDELLTANAVSTSIADLSAWTDNDESGATSSWNGSEMELLGTGPNAAIRDVSVTVSAPDQNEEHTLRVVVARGPVTLRVGSTSGGDEYITETQLATGDHWLSFTPTGNFYIRVMNRLDFTTKVDGVGVVSGVQFALTTPYGVGSAENVGDIRYEQSGDVVWIACKDVRPQRVERRGQRSWSIVDYLPEDGPFRPENVGPVTLSVSAITGNVSLTASSPLFRDTHVGSLFRLTSAGQQVSETLAGANQFSDPIRITGVGSGRTFQLEITGTWVGTVTLQRSVSEPGVWTDSINYTSNDSEPINDSLDNQIIYYRIGIKTGNYTSGSATAVLTYSAGSITGTVRVTAVANSTSASAIVLRDLGGTSATDVWAEGLWSPLRGYPSAVALHNGRLWWAGKDRIVGSVSDDFSSFDPDYEGDAAPINRSIGIGPVDTINWLVPASRLLVGGQGSEFSVKSSSLDEPLTPTNFNLGEISNQGSKSVQAVKVDGSAIFVQRCGSRMFQLSYEAGSYDYAAGDLTSIVPEIGRPGIVRLAVQRQPDTRVHCVRSDGTAAVLVFDKAENVTCWVEVETDGLIEDVCVLPGDEEDRVYYCVQRTIDGFDYRYIEKWSLESECVGGTLNKQADSFVTFTNSPAAASIPAGTASHLVGEEVVVWADGKCLRDADGNVATFTVAANGGIASLTNAGTSYSATTGIVGLAYEATFKSAKLAYAASAGTALNQKKRVDHIGLVLADTHAKGLKYGPDFENMDSLPEVDNGEVTDPDQVWESYDQDSLEFSGEYSTDSRICLKAEAPRPCTLLCATITISTNDKV
jgi:hypothetical protein